MSFLFGAFVFAFFYLRSLNSHDLWYPVARSRPDPPDDGTGLVVMALVVVSAAVQTLVLQRIKAGTKSAWLAGRRSRWCSAWPPSAVQVWQLTDLPFWPGASGFASVFVGFYPVYLTLVFSVMVWLEILIMRCRAIPQISFVEQPPTYAEAFAVQRFQAGLSSFTSTWNYMAVVAIIFWILFYLVH